MEALLALEPALPELVAFRGLELRFRPLKTEGLELRPAKAALLVRFELGILNLQNGKLTIVILL